MKRTMLCLSTFALLIVCSGAGAATEAQMKQAALTGDYQAQRNLAYSYANGWATPDSPNYVPKKPVEACAWYRVVIMSKSKKLHEGDFSNEWVYCRLPLDKSLKAWQLATELSRQISSR